MKDCFLPFFRFLFRGLEDSNILFSIKHLFETVNPEVAFRLETRAGNAVKDVLGTLAKEEDDAVNYFICKGQINSFNGSTVLLL
jgi:hypothetical protein